MKINKEIQEQLVNFIDNSTLSQSAIAKKMAVSPTTISLYLQSKYNGDNSVLEKKIKEFLEREAQRQKAKKFSFVQTIASKKIMNGCQLAFDTQDIVLIVGNAGLGKTISLKNYASNTEATTYIECDLTHTPKSILQEIAEQKKLVLEKKDFHSVNKAVVKALSSSDELIIFDEAELLSYKSLEVIRRLHDKTEAAIVLAGLPSLKNNLRGKKGENKQLFSRIGLVVDIGNELSKEDLTKIINSQEDLKPFVEDLIALSKGNPRRLNKIVKGAFRLLNKGEVLTKASFQNYSSLLLG